MLIKSLSYYFSLKGEEGGLSRLELTILPGPADPDAPHRQDAVRKDYLVLENLLDTRLLGHKALQMKKIPHLTDSPYQRTVGFDYQGAVKQTPLTKFFYLSLLPFFLHPKRVRQNYADSRITLTTNLSYNLVKIAAGQYKDPEFSLEIALRHRLTLDLLREVLNLPDMQLNAAAAEQLKELYGMLAQCKKLDPHTFLFLNR